MPVAAEPTDVDIAATPTDQLDTADEELRQEAVIARQQDLLTALKGARRKLRQLDH